MTTSIVWPFLPDWSNQVTETIEWVTDVMVTPSGAEQRRMLRHNPRRSLEATYLGYQQHRTLMDLLLTAAGAEEMLVPVGYDIAPLQTEATAGTATLVVDTTGREYYVGGSVLLRGETPFDIEVGVIDSIADGSLQLTSNLANTWPQGTRVLPLVVGVLAAQPPLTRLLDNAVTADVKFTVLEDGGWTPELPTTMYRGYPVFAKRPDESDDLTYTYQRLITQLDNGVGPPFQVDTANRSFPSQTYKYTAIGREKFQDMRGLLYGLAGRLNPVWMPTFFMDFELAAPLAMTDTVMIVKKCGFFQYSNNARTDIRIETRDGMAIYTQVSPGAEADDGTETVVLTSPTGVDLAVTDILRISFIQLMRMDQDSVTVAYDTDADGECSTVLTFRAAPDLRTALSYVRMGWAAAGMSDGPCGCDCAGYLYQFADRDQPIPDWSGAPTAGIGVGHRLQENFGFDQFTLPGAKYTSLQAMWDALPDGAIPQVGDLLYTAFVDYPDESGMPQPGYITQTLECEEAWDFSTRTLDEQLGADAIFSDPPYFNWPVAGIRGSQETSNSTPFYTPVRDDMEEDYPYWATKDSDVDLIFSTSPWTNPSSWSLLDRYSGPNQVLPISVTKNTRITRYENALFVSSDVNTYGSQYLVIDGESGNTSRAMGEPPWLFVERIECVGDGVTITPIDMTGGGSGPVFTGPIGMRLTWQAASGDDYSGVYPLTVNGVQYNAPPSTSTWLAPGAAIAYTGVPTSETTLLVELAVFDETTHLPLDVQPISWTIDAPAAAEAIAIDSADATADGVITIYGSPTFGIAEALYAPTSTPITDSITLVGTLPGGETVTFNFTYNPGTQDEITFVFGSDTVDGVTVTPALDLMVKAADGTLRAVHGHSIDASSEQIVGLLPLIGEEETIYAFTGNPMMHVVAAEDYEISSDGTTFGSTLDIPGTTAVGSFFQTSNAVSGSDADGFGPEFGSLVISSGGAASVTYNRRFAGSSGPGVTVTNSVSGGIVANLAYPARMYELCGPASGAHLYKYVYKDPTDTSATSNSATVPLPAPGGTPGSHHLDFSISSSLDAGVPVWSASGGVKNLGDLAPFVTLPSVGTSLGSVSSTGTDAYNSGVGAGAAPGTEPAVANASFSDSWAIKVRSAVSSLIWSDSTGGESVVPAGAVDTFGAVTVGGYTATRAYEFSSTPPADGPGDTYYPQASINADSSWTGGQEFFITTWVLAVGGSGVPPLTDDWGNGAYVTGAGRVFAYKYYVKNDFSVFTS